MESGAGGKDTVRIQLGVWGRRQDTIRIHLESGPGEGEAKTISRGRIRREEFVIVKPTIHRDRI